MILFLCFIQESGKCNNVISGGFFSVGKGCKYMIIGQFDGYSDK